MSDTRSPAQQHAMPVPPGLAVRSAVERDAFVVSVAGEVDLATVALLRAAVRDALRATTPAVVVDLGGCGFIDASGVQELVLLQRALEPAGRRLVVRPGPPQVQRVFDITGVTRVLFPPA